MDIQTALDLLIITSLTLFGAFTFYLLYRLIRDIVNPQLKIIERTPVKYKGEETESWQVQDTGGSYEVRSSTKSNS
jgi:hypothetical protein